MKSVAISLALLTLSFSAVSSAHADTLLGSSVTGTLDFNASPNTNRFSPASTIIETGTTPEFTYTVGNDTFTANFGALGVVIEIDCASSPCSSLGFTETFTDTAFTGDTFLTIPADNGLSLIHSISGDEITVRFTASKLSSDSTESVFEIEPAVAPTPEPGSLLLVGTGLISVAGAARRRFRKS